MLGGSIQENYIFSTFYSFFKSIVKYITLLYIAAAFVDL